MANRFLSNIKINDAYTFPASDGTNGQVIKTDGSGNLSFAQLAADSASVMYKDTFTGNGSTTAFTLANALNDEVQSNIYIDGVYQSKSTYSVSGTTVTFSTAPASGHEIEVISTTGINSGPTAIYTDTFTANGSATAFTLGQTVHNENQTIVFLNGVYQFKGTYTLSGTTLTLDTAPANGVAIEVMSIGSAYSGGDILYDHDFASAGLMTTNGSGVYSITANNSANWNTAYGWGDHSTQSYATQSYVGTQIANLVDSSPSTLNTLNELAAALGDDPNFATTTANSIGTKMPLAGGTFTGNVSLIASSAINLRVTDGTQNIYVGSSGNTRFGLGAGASIIQSTGASFGVGTQDGNSLILGTNNTAALTINTSQDATFAGDVIINHSTNTDSTLKLHSYSSAIGDAYAWNLTAENSGNSYAFRILQGTSPVFTIANTASGATLGAATFAGSVIANTGSKITSSSTDTTFSIETTSGSTIFPILDFVSSHSSAGARIRVSGTDVISLDKSQNATFAGDVTIGGKTYPKLNLTDSQGVARNFSVGTNNETFTVRNETAGSDAFTISNGNNATFAGNVQLGGTTPTLNFYKTSHADILANIKVESDTGTGGKLTIQTKRNGNTALDALVIYENQNSTFTGNVGIGTTSPNAQLEISNPNATSGAGGATLRLTRVDSTSVAGDPVGTIEFYSTDADTPKTTAYIKSMSEELYGRQGSLAFGVSQSINANATEAMRITSGGDVGIGTTTPGSLLTVRKDAAGGRGGEISIVNYASNTVGNEAALNFGLEGSTYHGDFGNAQIKARVNASNAASDMIFSTWNGSSFGERMRIGSSGNLSLATATSLNFNVGDAAFITAKESMVLVIDSDNNQTGRVFQIKSNGVNGDVLFSLGDNGQLGLGTTSPSEILHVNKNATSRIVGAYFTNSQANTGAEAVSIAFGLNRSGGDFVRKLEAIEYGAENQWTGTPSTVNSYLAFNVLKGESAFERLRVNSVGVNVTSHGAHGVHLKPDSADTNNSGRLILTRTGGSGWAVMNNSQNFSIRSGAIPASTSGTEKIRLTGYSATSWTSGSDETIKENIKPIGNVLDKINDYRCVEYNLIDDETKDKKIGFIAQDWQEDFPQIIEQMENEKIGMKYTETIPILLKAIQELKADNDSLKARIETLENN